VAAKYTFATVIPPNNLTYDGTWRVGDERIVAGKAHACD
jgi:hypothetical protein